MKNVEVTHYSVVLIGGNAKQLCSYEKKEDFDKWCDENLPGLYAKHGRDSICCRKHYSDGELTYFSKELK